MCGFICVYDRKGGIKSHQSAILQAGKRLAHRGPDDFGSYYDDFVGINFYRLSIIDTTDAGHQPMFSKNNNLLVANNGEIYNYKELRDSLKKRGCVFSTNSDTETLLISYQEYGDRFTEYLRGMFAFVIWDKHKKALTVARDRLGIKPLYIYKGEQIVIASEIKAITEYNQQAKNIDNKTVFKYLARGWLDDSIDTFYKDIKAIEPGTVIKISDKDFIQKRYWHLSIGEGRPFNPEEFREAFVKNVALHIRSDVPIASMLSGVLSGGMDSSSIVSTASALLNPLDTLRAFSIIPPHTVDESFWIDKITKYTGIEHSYLSIDFSNIIRLTDEAIKAHDEPFNSCNCIYHYLLRRKILGESVKVLLVGEGGDEVLGGYRRLFYPYLYSLLEDRRKKIYLDALNNAESFMKISKTRILKNLKNYSLLLKHGGSGQENISAYALLKDEFIHEYSDIVKEPAYPEGPGRYKNYFFSHLAQHLFIRDIPYILRMEDRNSMAYGIEARVPFLDHKFIELVFSYDYAEFMKNGTNKAMLRTAMADYLPKEVINRKSKSQRPGNDAHFVYGITKNAIMVILNSPQFKKSPYWKKDVIELFKKDCLKNNKERAGAWFRLYILMRWLDIIS